MPAGLQAVGAAPEPSQDEERQERDNEGPIQDRDSLPPWHVSRAGLSGADQARGSGTLRFFLPLLLIHCIMASTGMNTISGAQRTNGRTARAARKKRAC